MTRILVIDDDTDLLLMLQLLLEKSGYEVDTARGGEEGLRRAFEQPPDLVLLDLMMPVIDGYEICGRFKSLGNTPIIMLTARSDEQSLVNGLESGADDYLTKPYEAKVLLAKIKAVLRRTESVGPFKISYNDDYLSITSLDRAVLVNGQAVKLTATEFRLLIFLLKNADRVVPHEEIIGEIWSTHSEADRRSLKLYMLYLRRKIEKDPKRPVYLKTIWGIGYRFCPQS